MSCNPPNDCIILHLFEEALRKILVEDYYLLENNLNERSITHKLGEKLTNLFDEFCLDVDCEFNRNLSKPKEIGIDPEYLLGKMKNFMEDNVYKNMIRDKIIDDELGITYEQFYQAIKDSKVINSKFYETSTYLLKLGKKRIRKKIIPDVIVHKRGTNEHNLLVIEAKKSCNTGDAVYADIVKLATLVTDKKYNYRLGVFVNFPVLKDVNKTGRFVRCHSVFENVYEYSFTPCN